MNESLIIVVNTVLSVFTTVMFFGSIIRKNKKLMSLVVILSFVVASINLLRQILALVTFFGALLTLAAIFLSKDGFWDKTPEKDQISQ